MSRPRLSVVVPTRDRPAALCILSQAATVTGFSLEALAVRAGGLGRRTCAVA